MATDDPNSLAAVHVQHNRITRHDWATFAPHRRRVTELLITEARTDRATLCILGAGNGNDIDLSLLARRFEQITLVDLDPDALHRCVARVPARVATRVQTVAGVDLSGILTWLDSATEQPLSSQQIEQTIARMADQRSTELGSTELGPTELGRYDVVASTCLLTQMIDSVIGRLGPEHPRLADLTLALRDRHLKLVHDLTTPSGTALLITDFVSSDTLPQLSTVTDQQLESLLTLAIERGNFFTGVNPGVLAQRFGAESICGRRVRVQLYPPWRWQMGNRCYAVCATAARKG